MKHGRGHRSAVRIEAFPIRGGFTIARAQSTKPWWWWRPSATAPVRAEANACPMPAMARACPASSRRSRLIGPAHRAVSTAHRAPEHCCRLARRGTRSTARSGTSRRSSPAEARPRVPACRAAPRRGNRLHHLARLAGGDGGAAREAAHYPCSSSSFGGDGDEERLTAIRDAVPKARLIADANEACRPVGPGAPVRAAAKARA